MDLQYRKTQSITNLFGWVKVTSVSIILYINLSSVIFEHQTANGVHLINEPLLNDS